METPPPYVLTARLECATPLVGEYRLSVHQELAGETTTEPGTTSSGISYVFNVKDFEAVGDGAANDTEAFRTASLALEAAGGGTLLIPPGTYVVGQQTLAGEAGTGWAYKPEKIIWIEGCARPVRVIGHGAKLILANGLRFGAFDPVTGLAVGTSAVADNRAFATMGGMVALVDNQAPCVVEGLELDGNSGELELGGQSDSSGWQFGAYGVYLSGNDFVAVRDVYTHHHGTDGIALVWTGETDNAPGRRYLLENVRSVYNARQGCSWVGGIGMTAINCTFSHTGKGAFASGPGAGFDVEAESALIRNGLWINCEMVNNNSQGFVADSGDSADLHLIDCTIHSADGYSVWCTKPRVTYERCKISGEALGNYTASDPKDKTRFIKCTFDSSLTHGYGVYGSHLISASGNPIFEGCSFSAKTGTTVDVGSFSTACILRDCTITQDGPTGTALIQATFEGNNSAVFATGGADLTGHVVRGRLTYSGTISGAAAIGGEIPATATRTWGVRVAGNNGSALVDNQMQWSYQAPTSGAWLKGDVVWNSTVGAGGVSGWQCVTSGTPGTWKAMATVAP